MCTAYNIDIVVGGGRASGEWVNGSDVTQFYYPPFAVDVDADTHDMYVVTLGLQSDYKIYKLAKQPEGTYKVYKIAGNGARLTPSIPDPSQEVPLPDEVATGAALGNVAGITLHNGEVWLAENFLSTSNQQFGMVRKIATTSGMIRTVVGPTTQLAGSLNKLRGSSSIAWDRTNGDMLLLTLDGIMRVHINDDNTNIITPLVSGWRNKYALDMIMGPLGKLAVSLSADRTIVEVDPTSGAVSPLVGVSGSPSGYLNNVPALTPSAVNYPQSVSYTAPGEVIFTDYTNHAVRRVQQAADAGGNQVSMLNTIAGRANEVAPVSGTTGDGGLATSARLANPKYLRTTTDDTIYVWDNSDRVRKLTCAECAN